MARTKATERAFGNGGRGKRMDKLAQKQPRLAAPAPAAAPAAVAQGRVKRRHRFRPGTKALREIRKYQKSSDLLIPKLPFARLVRQTMQTFNNQRLGRVFRISSVALSAVQEAMEAHLVGILEEANLAAIHAKRVTVMKKDFDIVLEVRRRSRTNFILNPILPRRQ